MKEVTNLYDFLSEELTYYPELPQYSAAELQARENDTEFWEELSDQLYCFRICDHCNKPMIEGYCIDDGCRHYCSDECLHSYCSDEEFEQMSDDEDSTSYYTCWYEDSISYNE